MTLEQGRAHFRKEIHHQRFSIATSMSSAFHNAANRLEEGNAGRPAENKYSKKDETFWRYMKLLFCFTGLQVSYVLWGLVQEFLMTQDYAAGKFKSSSFCVFGNRFLALLISLGIVMFKRWTSPTPLKEAPFYYYAPASISNTLSSWAQYEALKFLSFPTQTLSKSCKIIPVMLVGIAMNGKSYPLQEYLEAAMITAGVTMFSLAERSGPSDHESAGDSSFGVILLAMYLCCDSFTSQWQSKVYKQWNIDQYQMMLGVNLWSMVLTACTLYLSGEFFSSFAFILSDNTALLHMIILSITSATGQLFIYYTLKEFGPVVFTIIMTTRQIFSLFFSLVLFGHSISSVGWISIICVFLVVFYRLYRSGGKD